MLVCLVYWYLKPYTITGPTLILWLMVCFVYSIGTKLRD